MVINTSSLNQKCSKYGLSYKNANIYDDIILVSTPTKRLYVVLDENYNTIGVEKITNQKLEEFISDFYERYSTNSKTFSYPFENYTLKNFIDLGNKIDIIEANHGNSSYTRINEKWYDRSKHKNDEYFKLLSYVKFISEEMKMYFLTSYHMQVMGFEFPDVYSYVNALMNNITTYINQQIANNQRPWPTDILSNIGQTSTNATFDSMLYDIADLLMKQKEVKVKDDDPYTLEEDATIKPDLSSLADKLLESPNLHDSNLEKSQALVKTNKDNN